MAAEPARRLVVNADDFGLSREVNTAVIRAHREGILTSASLMVGGPACDEAIQMAKDNPTLAVGLHLTLVRGRAVLPPEQIPKLIDPFGNFSDAPVWTGFRYWARPALRHQLRDEIGAQFRRFQDTGLLLDHVNGHLNLHLHPTVLDLLLSNRAEWGFHSLRLTRDPYELNRRITAGNWLYRRSHAVIFDRLCRSARRKLRQRRVAHTDRVFGLLQNGGMDSAYLTRLLGLLPTGSSEIYTHPTSTAPAAELDALINPDIRAQIVRHNIRLTTYSELAAREAAGAEEEFKVLRTSDIVLDAHPETPPSPHVQTDNPAPARSDLRGDRSGPARQGPETTRRRQPRKPRGVRRLDSQGGDPT